jgi:hypothetical protein
MGLVSRSMTTMSFITLLLPSFMVLSVLQLASLYSISTSTFLNAVLCLYTFTR